MEPDTLPEPELDARLAALRVAGSRLDTPRCVEKELMQAFAARFPPRPPWYRRMNLAEWGAAGACATVHGHAGAGDDAAARDGAATA